MRAVPLYATIGSLVLSALAAVPATADGGPGPASSAEERGTAVAAARASAAGIAFGACPEEEMLPDTLKCGTVSVPLDYAEPDGRTIDLTVSRALATGPAAGRQGSFVYNPGGPGASSITFPLMGEMSEWKEVAEAYDMVGYAPRGVGASAPLSCQNPAAFAKSPTDSPAHPTAAYKEQRIAQARAYARGCEKHAGEALRHYTSLNNARDLEVLRAALGDERLTFMGASYGTYLGSLYATLFPSRVRRMVFDSAVDPDPEQIWYRSNLDQSLAFESRWEDFRRWVAQHDDVYGLGTTPEAVQGHYDDVRTALATEPAGGKVGPGQFHAAFRDAAYYDDYWAMRATALSEYVRGNPEPLVTQMSPRAITAKDDENARAVYTAIECNDAPWPEEWEVWDRDHTDLARIAPFQTWDNAFTNLPCAFWPAPRQQPLDVSTGWGELPPVLILAAERDAATPYKGALELQRRLRGAVLVTERDAGTHGVGGAGNACVDEHLRRYLLTGATPDGDAECAPRAEPNPVSLD
ncbi:alpha/beta hydrolase [Streptomyces sp. ME02-6991-2A]|uniref:alpha/beta hydrolase n=1 Tax=Streptomyces sp. ME02-6991-2A TaxID=3028677 RepID=UPI0029AFA22C|nr:alpha/beta hydrolase [Streptomyces sp. ME02-6991-2A]MDX3373115.1 alpha/beta hydrolase [Streptomyces sp. ME02-6991-2A]